MSLAAFEDVRPRLFALAYRMTGSVSEAEDILQDAWLRWSASGAARAESPRAYLGRIVARLCLDRARSARVRRECYVGVWLPEPLVETENGPEAHIGRPREVSNALLLLLQRLTPAERAAFLLHDVFELSFPEIARVLEREEAACRQLAVRARKALARPGRETGPVAPDEAGRLARAFWKASRTGDVQGLSAILAEGVLLRTDGGGKARAALNTITGRDRTIRMFEGLARKRGFALPPEPVWATINGAAGFVSLEADGVLQTTTFDIEAGRISAIWIQRNPEKLGHVTPPRKRGA